MRVRQIGRGRRCRLLRVSSAARRKLFSGHSLFGVLEGNAAVLQKAGVEKILGTGELSAFEKGLLEKALPELKASIDKGVKFVQEG